MPLGDLRKNMIRVKVGFLTEEEMLEPLKQIAAALEIVHNFGYIHNAVKPENIYIDRRRKEDGKIRVKLGGFSKSVKAKTNSDKKNLSEDSIKCPYQAPEVLLGLDPKPSSDIWSIGIILFALATGHFPVFS